MLTTGSRCSRTAGALVFLAGLVFVVWTLLAPDGSGDTPSSSSALAQGAEEAVAGDPVAGDPVAGDPVGGPIAGSPYSFWSLVPAILALGIAFLTKEVLLALFVGVVAGSVVVGAHSGEWSDYNFIRGFFLPALGTQKFAKILLVYLWFLGGLLGVWAKTGGARYFAERIGAHLSRGPRTARVFAWIVGCIFHQGGTVSTVLAGTTVKPVSDRHRVSHEELAYIVDSTASPVATVIPFNAWPAYIGGLVVGATAVSLGGYVLVPTASDGVAWFFESIPFNFYGILAVFMTLLFSLDLLPWVGGRMRAAIKRSRETGALDSPDARPLIDADEAAKGEHAKYRTGLDDFLVPLALLLGIAIIPYIGWKADSISEAFCAATIGAMVLATLKGMPLRVVLEGFVDGCKSMTVGALILGLAVTLGEVSSTLRTADQVIAWVAGMPPWVLPAALTAICMIVAFSVGSSFATYAVVFPLAVPLALQLGLEQAGAPAGVAIASLAGTHPEIWASALFFVKICFGAVIGGSVFGDQCSPISDTTILSSMFCGCDLMDHVRTQLPLALLAAGIGAVLSTLLVFFV